jgi:F0F1-type ATP synthase membrane subunit c/vacuolar-type H+-ATPase subunit K
MWNNPMLYRSRSNQPGADPGPEGRLRVMRILWVVFLVNIGLFVVLCQVAAPDRDEPAVGVPTLLLVLLALGFSTVAASFLVKPGFYRRAAERHEPAHLQTGFILALALCEAAALLGVVAVFVTSSGYAYLLFALGALGQAAHFPTREQVMSAYFKPGM